MGNKKNYILLILCLIFMAGCSRIVEDSRAMTPPKDILKDTRKKITRQIEDTKALIYDDYRYEIIANAAAKSFDAPGLLNPIIDISQQVEPEIEVVDSKEDVNETLYLSSSPELTYLGQYEITAYEYTGSACANGNYPTPWYTVACNSLPFGTELYIDGVGYVIVEDRGASWHSDNWLDLYIGDIDACYDWGRQYRDVYLVG